MAVLPFEVLSENKEYKQFGPGTMDTITVALTGIPGITMIDRGRMTNILKEQSFQSSGFTDIKESIKAGKLLGAQILVTGSIQGFDNQFRIAATFIEVQTGKILKATKVTGSNIFELQDKIAEQLIDVSNIKLTSEQRKEVTKITKVTKSTSAYENYTIGRTFYYKVVDNFFKKHTKDLDENDLNLLNSTIEYFNKSIETDKNYFLAIAARAEVETFLYVFYVQSEKYKDFEKGRAYLKQAKDDANLAYKISQTSGPVYRALALTHQVNGSDPMKTVEYSLKAIKYNPDDKEAYMWLAVGYYTLGEEAYNIGKWDEAIKNFKNTIKYFANSEDTYFYLGRAYYKINEIDKSIETYEKFLALKSGNKELEGSIIVVLLQSYNKKIEEYYKNSDFKNLEKVFLKKLQYRTKDPDTYNNLGLAYYMQKKYIPAEEMYKKAIELSPEKGSFYDNLGLLYQAKGNTEQANTFFKKACELGNSISCK